jgi:Bacterial Ig domain
VGRRRRTVYGISNGVDAGIAIDAAITALAVPGDPMPGGTLAGAHFPLVNNSGQVAFYGSLAEGTAHFFRTTVTPGDPVVAMGSSNGGSMLFGMNDLGHIAYLGHPPSGPGSGPAALFVSDGTTQTAVVVATPDFILEPHMTPINDAGHVAGVAQDGSATPVRRVYVWHGSGLWEVIGQGDGIPGLGTVLDFSIGNDSLNDRDQLAIAVRYDAGGGSDKYAVVRADPVNVAPVAADASLSAVEDTPAAGTLVGSDVHSDPLTFSIVASGTLGTATITDAATGAFNYVPDPDAHGTDTFTFKVSDGVFDSNIATVSVTIAPVNDPPVATGDSVLAVSGLSIHGFLQASDVDGPPLTFSLVSNASLGSAVITNTTTGAFTYTPPAGSSGNGVITPMASLIDTVTFKASDGALDSNVATVMFTLRVDDAPPSLLDLRVVTRDGRAVAGRLAATNLPPGRPTFELVSSAERGTVSLRGGTGAFVYRPRQGVYGVDRFTVRVRAGLVTSNVAEVTVVVEPRVAGRR